MTDHFARLYAKNDHASRRCSFLSEGDVKRAMMLLKRAIDDDPTLQSARQLLDALQAEA